MPGIIRDETPETMDGAKKGIVETFSANTFYQLQIKKNTTL
jgi:hypothetical protein